jgi:hypothetical protein
MSTKNLIGLALFVIIGITYVFIDATKSVQSFRAQLEKSIANPIAGNIRAITYSNRDVCKVEINSPNNPNITTYMWPRGNDIRDAGVMVGDSIWKRQNSAKVQFKLSSPIGRDSHYIYWISLSSLGVEN